MRWITLGAALFISIFLAIAAYGKFFYPFEKLRQLDRLTSYFEIVLITLLFVFRMRYALWLLAALVFSSWGGYAAYFFWLQLPCNCAGSLITLPSGLALGLDALFFVLSCSIAFFLGASRSLIYLTALCACLFLLVGYAFGEWIFFAKVLKMPWSVLQAQ